MMSSVKQEMSQAWKDKGFYYLTKETIKLGGVFKIKWFRFSNVPFAKLGDIKNPLNENEPVKKSRDT